MRRPRSAATTLLALATSAAALTGFGLAGAAAWQAASSAGAGTSQQHAAATVERALTARPAQATGRLPVAAEPRPLGVVATIRVPRFGAGWVRTIRQGVGKEVLDSATAGVGHYPGTAMPGGLGNFAVAGHDTGWGDAFRRLGELRLGDEVRVRTAAGVYVYAFRDFRWVPPTAVDVLLPVPERPRAAVAARLITITTCDPPYHAAERFVAYGQLVRFEPRRGEARTLVPAATSGAAASFRSALRGAPLDRAGVLRRLRSAGLGADAEVTQSSTSVGRAVPAMQVAVRRGRRCLVGQIGGRAAPVVRTFPPIAGRCLLGDPTALSVQ